MYSMNPKELRAQARKLNELARTIEMAQNPQAFIEKKMKAQLNGAKRKMKNQVVKNLTGM